MKLIYKIFLISGKPAILFSLDQCSFHNVGIEGFISGNNSTSGNWQPCVQTNDMGIRDGIMFLWFLEALQEE